MEDLVRTYNRFIFRIAPQLRRIKRKGYTLFIENETGLLDLLNTRILKEMYLPALNMSSVKQFFESHESFDALSNLVVSQDEPNDDDEFCDPSEIKEGIDSVRPLLQTVAARVKNLEFLSVFLTSLEDEDGILINDVKRIVEANQRSLKILNFAANLDSSNERPSLASTARALEWLNHLFDGALDDHFKWHTLPDAVRDTFGVDISQFRILGYALWPIVMHDYAACNSKFPLLDSAKALFNAVYPKDRTSCGDRIQAFEFLLYYPPISAAERTKEDSLQQLVDYAAWMLAEAKQSLEEVDPRSQIFTPSILGLLSISTLQQLIGSSYEETLDHVINLARISNPQAPLNAIFQALEEHRNYHDIFQCEELTDFIIQNCRGMKIDVFAEIGEFNWPLGISLRRDAPKAFERLIQTPESFDPLARDPFGNTPAIVFCIIHPNWSSYRKAAKSEEYFSRLIEILERVRPELGEFRFGPVDLIVQQLERTNATVAQLILTDFIHPLDLIHPSIIRYLNIQDCLDPESVLSAILAKLGRHPDATALLEKFSSNLYHEIRTHEHAKLATAAAKMLDLPQDIKTKFYLWTRSET